MFSINIKAAVAARHRLLHPLPKKPLFTGLPPATDGDPKKEDGPITKLPMELLQMIAGFADTETSILHMRLACKLLYAAALDAFAAEYLRDLKCFLLDPQRLLRVNRILETPELAKKVRCVTFTVCPYEQSESVIVPDDCETPSDALLAANKHYSNVQYQIHASGLARNNQRNWNLMADIMKKIHLQQRASVQFWLVDPYPMFDSYRDGLSAMDKMYGENFSGLQDLLFLAHRHGCKVSGFNYTDKFQLKASEFKEGGRFCHTLQDLKNLQQAVRIGKNKDYRYGGVHNSLQVLETIASRASKVESYSLHLNTENSTMDEWTMMTMSGDFLKAVTFPSLSTLRLCTFHTHPDLLRACIQQYAHSLKHLTLISVNLCDRGDPWTPFLQEFAHMPRLEELKLVGLWRWDPIEDKETKASFWHPHTTIPKAWWRGFWKLGEELEAEGEATLWYRCRSDTIDDEADDGVNWVLHLEKAIEHRALYEAT